MATQTVTKKRTRKVAISAKDSLISAKKATAKATLQVEAFLGSYAEAQCAAEELKKVMDDLSSNIDKKMKEHNLDPVEHAGWTAERVDVKTNGKNTTDPEKLFDLLEDNDDIDSFWGAVTVSATKVKKVVTGKEYDSITDSVPGKITGQKLKLAPTKKTVTSK